MSGTVREQAEQRWPSESTGYRTRQARIDAYVEGHAAALASLNDPETVAGVAAQIDPFAFDPSLRNDDLPPKASDVYWGHRRDRAMSKAAAVLAHLTGGTP